jgi:hypothetical protein
MTHKFKGRGVTQLTGRSAHTIWIDEMSNSKVKIIWERLPGLQLRARSDTVPPRGRAWGLDEHDIDPIQKWCEEHNCGVRTSFDIFKFRKPSDISMFLLRWS